MGSFASGVLPMLPLSPPMPGLPSLYREASRCRILQPHLHFLLPLLCRCRSSLPDATDAPDVVRPLPRKLYLQLDNSARDNKNQYIMAFLSLLTARKVFQEIQVGFLLVGHTHEDIDGYFSYLSKQLKTTNTFVLSDLMKTFMESQFLSFIPELIQEVADFKSFIKGYAQELVGLKEMHIFRFFLDNDDWPVFQYKKSALDPDWLPRSSSVRMWKDDGRGRPLLPSGDPPALQIRPPWGHVLPGRYGDKEVTADDARDANQKKDGIRAGIRKYIKIWESGCLENDTYHQKMEDYVTYWKDVAEELDAPFPPTPPTLQLGFWPSTSYTTPNSSLSDPVQTDTTPEDVPIDPFCGVARDKPKESYNPYRDVLLGDFVLVRPSDPDLYPVWMGRALTAVQLDRSHPQYGQFQIRYWRPTKGRKKISDHDRYKGAWDSKWECDPSSTAVMWIECSSVLYSNRARKNTNDTSVVQIGKFEKKYAQRNLELANSVSQLS